MTCTERAGSTNVLHLHGELLKVRSTGNASLVLNWHIDLQLGDSCNEGHQLRPHIVWFGEDVPLLPRAAEITQAADILIIIGTSMQVYPAASLVNFAPAHSSIHFIDPKPSVSKHDFPNLTIIAERAAVGVPILVADLLKKIP